MKRKSLRILYFSILVVFFILVVGCSSSDSSATESQVSEAVMESNDSIENTLSASTSIESQQMLIFNANLLMEVENFQEAYDAVQNLIDSSESYVVKYSESKSSDELNGTLTIKVPAERFKGLISKISDLPNKSFQQNMYAQDVSEEFVDLKARLKAKQVVEQRLLTFIDNAENTNDLVLFSTELGIVQEEIERIKGRMNYLEQNVAYSTIELEIYEKLKPKLSGEDSQLRFGERIASAWFNGIKVFIQVSVWFVTLLIGMIPIILIGALIGGGIYWWKRRRAKS